MVNKNKGIRDLFKEVIDQGLCTGCGACVGRCPYIDQHGGRVVRLNRCTVENGQCYKYCPRTYTDMNALSIKLFGKPYGKSEIGHFSAVHLIRSTNKGLHNAGQDGGTVITLLSLALKERIIDCVACTRMDENKVPYGYIARSADDLIRCAGSSYESGYALNVYRKIPKDNTDNFGIVGVGCQIESLSKMKADAPEDSADPERIRLMIGLFCGWSLSQQTFHPFMEKKFDLKRAVKFDIPHSPNYTFDVFYNEKEKDSVSLDEIKPHINSACQYCWDMTAEFADISVGSAGSALPGWNTIIVRNERGAHLVNLARKMEMVECGEIPEARLNHLRTVASKRKKTAFKNIINKTGDEKDLLYINSMNKEVIQKYMDE